MIDRDLANLYGVETRTLKQAEQKRGTDPVFTPVEVKTGSVPLFSGVPARQQCFLFSACRSVEYPMVPGPVCCAADSL